MKTPKTAIIVGAGHRACIYAEFAKANPHLLQIVGVADPDPQRRKRVQQHFQLSEDQCYDSAETLARHGKLADAIINGTMDQQHVETSIPLLRVGYDLLLEKPFAVNETEMHALLRVVHETGRKVMVCHVLRYSPFYAAIKQHLLDGAIGDVLHIDMTEQISYHHLAVSYIRGKWGKEAECGAPMLLSKCSHDMDLLLWMKNAPIAQLTSFGEDFQFAAYKMPSDATERCMACPRESECLYSAKKHYLETDRWDGYVWDELKHLETITQADKVDNLATTNRYGRCVWACEHDVVDHQTVVMQFADGATGTLHMIGGTPKSSRNVRIVGTKGELFGTLEDGFFTHRSIAPHAPKGYQEAYIAVSEETEQTRHRERDTHIMEDFVRYLNDEELSISSTALAESVQGHNAIFKAELSRKTRQTVSCLNFDRSPNVAQTQPMFV